MAEDSVRDVLLKRKGLVFLSRRDEWTGGVPHQIVTENQLRAVDLSLAEIGYTLSSRLRAQLGAIPLFELALVREHVVECLAKSAGARDKHVPLFRNFPEDVPADTTELWWKKVLAHFMQAEKTPCLFCRRTGTTHVLRPCAHVVCNHCWDGANYSACPVCEQHVDRTSPFFQRAATDDAPSPKERVTFKLLDLGESVDDAARALFVSLCERQQAMSPIDVNALTTIVAEYGERIATAIPAKITVKENRALVFGTLLQRSATDAALSIAKKHLTTATDVLRMIAVLSGADASLQGVLTNATVRRDAAGRWANEVNRLSMAPGQRSSSPYVYLRYTKKRFKVARLSRAFRRAVLAILESFDPERLTEDMLRHRSYWVWIGEHLHPSEYATRFPHVARAFAIVREHSPDGTSAPSFRTFASSVERAIAAGDVEAALVLLRTRPGDLARRLDHLLRIAAGRPGAVEAVVHTFVSKVPSYSMPVLLTLWSALPTRVTAAPVRMYWPKGASPKGSPRPTSVRRCLRKSLASRRAQSRLRSSADSPRNRRSPRPSSTTRWRRSPFLSTSARRARSAVQLARGSRVPSDADGKLVRLFLHWCQPKGGYRTDIDLSVAFYDSEWKYQGVCSYYEPHLHHRRQVDRQERRRPSRWAIPGRCHRVRRSRRAAARGVGVRYAVMVVNAFAGMTFDQLERGYAGIMLRDDAHGAHFDPRTVALKFALQGDNGTFMPLVFDVDDGSIHWMDVYSTGRIQFNNVATSNADVARICPAMMTYFASGVRPTMRDLALMHAAARVDRVHLRALDGTHRALVRGDAETPASFLARLRRGEGASRDSELPAPDAAPVFAALYKGDVALPAKSVCYALFRESQTGVIAASDLVG